MLKVRCEVTVHEIDGKTPAELLAAKSAPVDENGDLIDPEALPQEVSQPIDITIEVSNHPSHKEHVVLSVGEQTYSVSAADLSTAIQNAMNRGK